MANIFAASMLWRTKTTLYSWLSRGEFALNGFRNADARIASSAGQPGSTDFVSQACGSAANVPHIGVSGPDLSAVRHLVRIATEYQIQDFDVFSIRLETRCPVGTEPGVEIKHLGTCDEDGPNRPIETQRLFVAEIPAGAETKERESPPVSLCPKTKNRIGLLFPRI